MVIVVFRSRLRPEADQAEVVQLGERMYGLASAMPGFVAYKDFEAADGESLTLVEFESTATLLAWRDHPEHLAVQARGREAFFSEYQISVCEPQRAYRFSLEQGRVDLM